jgi:probable blue pigment (indigoidine) exporter
MEVNHRGVWVLVAAVGPVLWGATYLVTRTALPADSPLWGAALRALPAGIGLLLLARRLPRGSWWWRSGVLGLLNFGAFFVLVYVAAQLLPSSVASSVMATAPFALAGIGWLLLRERITPWMLTGAVAGVTGVLLIVGLGSGVVSAWGIAASVGALLANSVGSVLTKRWRDDDAPLLASTAWQLLAGGLALTLVAGVVEGPPPTLDATGWLAIGFLSILATAVAFVCWFAGIARLPVGIVGVIGLLNPVTGVLLGTLVGGEVLTPAQGGGIALVLVGIALGTRRWGGSRTPRASRRRDSVRHVSDTAPPPRRPVATDTGAVPI